MDAERAPTKPKVGGKCLGKCRACTSRISFEHGCHDSHRFTLAWWTGVHLLPCSAVGVAVQLWHYLATSTLLVAVAGPPRSSCPCCLRNSGVCSREPGIRNVRLAQHLHGTIPEHTDLRSRRRRPALSRKVRPPSLATQNLCGVNLTWCKCSGLLITCNILRLCCCHSCTSA